MLVSIADKNKTKNLLCSIKGVRKKMVGSYQFIKFGKNYCNLPFQLTYHSVAKPDISLKDVEDIMSVATKKNAELDVTGCLIYHNKFFLQILEGDKDVVLKLFDTIKLDARNDQVTLLSTDESQFRIFKEWSMAYYQIPEKTELNPEEEQVKQELLQISDTSKKPNFTLKVFWYNVRQILLSEGYYRSNIAIVPTD